MKLDSSVAAVVTGGASGLGEATVRALAAHGVKVAIFDMNADKGEAVAARSTSPTTPRWRPASKRPAPPMVRSGS